MAVCRMPVRARDKKWKKWKCSVTVLDEKCCSDRKWCCSMFGSGSNVSAFNPETKIWFAAYILARAVEKEETQKKRKRG